MTPSPHVLAEAVSLLGWRGELVGPISWGGVRFWAARDGEELGCLVAGADGERLQLEASLLAPYARRAVLLPRTPRDLLPLQVEAAVLDQGLLVAGPGGVELLAGAGPRTAPGWSARGLGLLAAVEAAPEVASPAR